MRRKSITYRLNRPQAQFLDDCKFGSVRILDLLVVTIILCYLRDRQNCLYIICSTLNINR